MEMCVPPTRACTGPFLKSCFYARVQGLYRWSYCRLKNGTVGLEWMADNRVPSTPPTRDARGWVRPRAAVNPNLETSCSFECVRAPHTVRFADQFFYFGGTS